MLSFAEIIDAVHKLFPVLASFGGLVFFGFLHWKNRQLDRRDTEIARKFADFAEQSARNNIQTLEEKVKADEADRLEKERRLDSLNDSTDASKSDS